MPSYRKVVDNNQMKHGIQVRINKLNFSAKFQISRSKKKNKKINAKLAKCVESLTRVKQVFLSSLIFLLEKSTKDLLVRIEDFEWSFRYPLWGR